MSLPQGTDRFNPECHEQEKRERKKREIKRRKEREAYLKKLSKDFPKVWKAVRHTVERGAGLAYDEVCCALVDLSEAYLLHASRKQFQQELRKFMAGHMRRKALIQRLVKAGIWVESLERQAKLGASCRVQVPVG
jgi:hypothetical protein